MTNRAIIKELRADLESNRRDLWLLAADAAWLKDECKRLQAIVDRQDGTILALWSMIEKAEKQTDAHWGQCWGGADTPDERDREEQADEAPSDCISDGVCHDGCSASYAEGCGAYLAKECT